MRSTTLIPLGRLITSVAEPPMGFPLSFEYALGEQYVLIIWLSVLEAITLLTGSTLAQIPETFDADWMTYNRALQGVLGRRVGKVFEDAVMTDALSIMQQLGLGPSARKET
jgi:hypothetical protein